MSVCLVPSFVSAAEDDYEVKDSKVITVKDETVKLETWVDSNGEEFYVVPHDVKNKREVAEHIDMLLTTESDSDSLGDQSNVITPQAEWDRVRWYRNIENRDSLGYVTWSTSGYSEYAYLRPITANLMRVNDGNMEVLYVGSGLPDKIISSYDYTFSGLEMGISYSPSLVRFSNKVSWTSSPITGTYIVKHKTHWAEVTSRTSFPTVTINAAPDVYKGSYIYRPRVNSKVVFNGS
ncbi:hypothetical protein [Ferdinandcohnia sp. SAFN-114]|uniref:hypothetical protein n=1 Tax=Ferdinandcohnia sp. SAFN-114 TaxID=3387275 RepID=UPI003F7F2A61